MEVSCVMHRSYHCTTWKAFITESWTFATLRNSALNHLLTNIESYFEQGLTNGSQLQQTRILFIRSFHFHGKTYWYASVYYYFLSAKKKIYAEMRMEKLCGPFYSTSRKMFLIHPAYLTFDPLRSYSTYCEKPLLADLLQNHLHHNAGTSIYNETLISWWKRTFVIASSMILQRVIALESWWFLA